MDMHQCPRCELRFVNTSELRQHFAVDHGGDASVFERYRYRAGPPRGAPPARTLLLVANQTLEQGSLLDEVAARAAGGARVLVLVPATHRGDDHDAGAAIARWRLGAAVDRLHAAGVVAEGVVGEADPFTAVTRLLAREHVDEILVSTLPPSISHWLGVDLPGRLRRHTHHPVHVLSATSHPGQPAAPARTTAPPT